MFIRHSSTPIAVVAPMYAPFYDPSACERLPETDPLLSFSVQPQLLMHTIIATPLVGSSESLGMGTPCSPQRARCLFCQGCRPSGAKAYARYRTGSAALLLGHCSTAGHLQASWTAGCHADGQLHASELCGVACRAGSVASGARCMSSTPDAAQVRVGSQKHWVDVFMTTDSDHADAVRCFMFLLQSRVFRDRTRGSIYQHDRCPLPGVQGQER